ncbi:thymidylate synthase [Sulfitobacter phage vB_SupP_AX]|nr:thymidylate synthase [Sulfitobacter phage vB_SupP_AX]
MSKYHDYWLQNGQPSYSEVAKHFGVNESTARRSIQAKEQKIESRAEAEPAVINGMDTLGFEGQPHSGWIKSDKPDKNGNTYSYYFLNKEEEKTEAERMQQIADRFTGTSPVLFKRPTLVLTPRIKKAFISINDLHSGALAWGLETGYGDWDLPIAMTRLEDWLCRLFDHVEKEQVQEIILYYNGDILHANGQVPMTATHGSDHILDVDSRHFKVVDTTGEQIIHTTDIAAQIADVRLVIKRGNHDGDSYLSLLQGAKWRYANQENVTVELDPNAYWAHIFGKVALFGHHGDKIKPDRLVMQFLQRYRKEVADVEHITVWTGDKHHRKVEQFPGVMWEQASNWSEPDLYGSAYGETAMAQAVIYDELEGEVSRFTVKPSQVFGDENG